MLGSLLTEHRKRLPHFRHAAHFAVALGCTREHYRRIEAGTGYPSPALMQRIVDLLELGPDQALGLWLAWGLEKLPNEIIGKIQIFPSTISSEVADAVHADLLQFIDLGEEDREALAQVIDRSMRSKELKWR